ncbi:MAG: thiamine pyrophosphate-dependent enzyme [bacterium]
MIIDKKDILLGNQAIVQGALENGVQFVSTYPGTPASEIGDSFAKIAQKNKIIFEYSINEKVALEAGAGAAFSGLKTLVAMKSFGLNIASDFLIPLMCTGIQGALVLAIADDPGCSSSAQSEQDSRAYSYLAHIPTLEPSDPHECKDFTKLAFEISEKYKIPVMIRTTTRVALQSAPVKLGKIINNKTKAKFIKNFNKFVTMPPRVLQMKKELLEKIEKIKKQVSEKSEINKIYPGKSRLGIITSGVAFLYVQEALQELKLDLPVLKLGFFYPLPKNKINNFIKNLDKILIIEELEPWLQREININKKLITKIGELKPEIVIKEIAKFTGKKFKIKNLKLKINKISPRFCPGCPYWLIFQAVKNATKNKQVIFGGEIGCYMLAGQKPFNLQDYLFCMGSSISIGHGINKSTNQKIIAFVGDSSFFHAGIPALINAVYNQSNILIIILDNKTTAMTGHQPNPGSKIKIENIIKACEVQNLKIINPKQIKLLESTIKEFLDKKALSVIIARSPCIRI